MKKIFMIMISLVMFVGGINAQKAIETSKFFDNWYVGVLGGVAVPMSEHGMFENYNPMAGLKVGKNITPVFGLNAEGTSWFNGNHFNDAKTFVKATNVGLNATVNLSNALFGYPGRPRVFEVSTETGLGWLRFFDKNYDNDELSAKTGIKFAFNLGRARAWQIFVEPAVYWNLTHNIDDAVQFSSRHAQIALQAGLVYKFKNSNRTHNFVQYDIKALNDETNRLRNAESEVKTVVDTVTVNIPVPNKHIVTFEQGKAELDDAAINELNSVSTELPVDIIATASPEGTKKFNKRLSEERATVVKNYLESRGVKVNSAKGLGVTGSTSNRVAIVTVE